MFRAPTNALYDMMPQPTCLPSILKMQGNRVSALKVNCWKPVLLVTSTITSHHLPRKNLFIGSSICAIKALIPYNGPLGQATWVTPLSFTLSPNVTTPNVPHANMARQSTIPLNPKLKSQYPPKCFH